MMFNLEEDTVAQHGHLVEEKEHSHSYEDRSIAISWMWWTHVAGKECQNLEFFEPRFTAAGEDGFPGPNGVDKLADRQMILLPYFYVE